MATFEPRYLELSRNSDLKSRAEAAAGLLADCTLCPRKCHVDRSRDELGFCRTGSQAVIAGFDAHFGEESPLVGEYGSGTIFFSHCNLGCNFCQNFPISRGKEGHPVSHDQLARVMLNLQKMGCHNINFVTPTHVLPQILAALVIAAQSGLHIPLVYNSSGYDRVETLNLLDGVIDIYMPDFKFWSADIAELTCRAPDYPEMARRALMEMHRQVGDLRIDNGLAEQGLLVRHLVLPDGMAGTAEVMRFIAEKVSSSTYVNVMAQYRPCGEAYQTEGLDRAVSRTEFETALMETRHAGITRIDKRRRVFVSR